LFCIGELALTIVIAERVVSQKQSNVLCLQLLGPLLGNIADKFLLFLKEVSPRFQFVLVLLQLTDVWVKYRWVVQVYQILSCTGRGLRRLGFQVIPWR
jgi:hypothetical protein